jgi:DNA (cytosine-5)-methyltransferase 1
VTPRIGSMCTGYGGLDTAVVEVLGGSVAWHAEVDPDASKVLAHRYPKVPNLGDITAADWSTVEPVDIVTAGFPCQDISYAGRGAGIQEGNRSGLWHHIADALGVLRPRFVVLENVAAIVARRPGLDVVLADLAALGFDAEWTCVRASDVGAPHGRDRWFLVAAPGDSAMRGWHDPSTTEGRHQPAKPAGRPDLPVADALGDGRHEGRSEPAGILRGPDASIGGRTTSTDSDRGRFPGIQKRHGPSIGGQAHDEQRRLDVDGRVLDWGPYGPAIRRWEQVTGVDHRRPRHFSQRTAAHGR